MAALTALNLSPVVVQSNDGKVFQFPGEPEAQQFEQSAKDAGGETLRLVPITPPAARPLYALEQHLASLIDTEDMVPAELEEQFAQEFQDSLIATVEKRDRVGQFRLHLAQQVGFAHAEMQRIRDLEAFYQRALDRLDNYITRTIESLGLDEKGKRKKLEGHVCTLGLHGCDKRVDVTDEAAVPSRYKLVTLTLPVDTWEALCDSLDFDWRDRVLDEAKGRKVEVSNSMVKPELKAGATIPGAVLAGGTYVTVK